MNRLIFAFCILFSATSLFAQNWLITGNAGTTADNFLGTTDARSLRFRANNQVSGIIDYTNSLANTSFGYQSLRVNTGNNNAAFGFKSMWSNTSGRVNTALGAYSLYNNTTGYSNVALGIAALFGSRSLRNTVAVGDSALYYATTGLIGNTAIGSKSLCLTTQGSYNTGIGFQSLQNNIGGSRNTAGGYNAMRLNEYGYNNVALGSGAMEYARSGYENVAVGLAALAFDSLGDYNTAVGSGALRINGNGDYNAGVGLNALSNLNSGNNNTAVGVFSLSTVTTGSSNTGVGAFTNVNAGTYANTTTLGYQALGTASNQVRIGNASVTSIGGYVNWTNISDGRVKKNMQENVPGLAFINKLKPVTYNLDLDAADKISQRPVLENAEVRVMEPGIEALQARKEKEKKVYSGFVAQQVEQAARSVDYEFSGVDAAKNDKDLYGLRYAEFVVPLVKAVQELSTANDEKDATIAQLQNDLQEMKTQISQLLQAYTSVQSGSSQTAILNAADGASLKQNVPNPYTNATVVNFSLPRQYTSAMIVVTDMHGKTIQRTNVAGSTSLRIAAGSLTSGSYTYSLIVDGNIISTKTMVIAK